MSTTPLSFSNVTSLITNLAADLTASNTAIQTQLMQVKQLLVDYAGSIATGNGVSQADLQTAISALETIDTNVQANTQSINDSASAITAGDPNASGTPVVPVIPTDPTDPTLPVQPVDPNNPNAPLSPSFRKFK